MTNNHVGLVYQRIIESVIEASTTDFEESGVASTTLQELQQEWQSKLSARAVAEMPWDPKPVVQPQPTPQPVANGLPSGAYSAPSYDPAQVATSNGGTHIKQEPGLEQQQFHGLPPAPHAQNGPPPQGGFARAQQLVQQAQYANTMQRNGLALPGQQVRQQGMPMPGTAQVAPGSVAHDQFQHQQQLAMQRQQQALQAQKQHQQYAQPQLQSPAPIKVENETPNYSQTDGADDDLAQWRAMLAERHAVGAEQQRQADRMMYDQVMKMTEDLQNGLMVPLDEQPSLRKQKRRPARATTTSRLATTASSSNVPSIPQLDGEDDDDDDDVKDDVKDEDDEDDENAINSDLDDSDDDAQGQMGEDDDEEGDAILCTYDKVQRVKNKWKCTLKDGVMIAKGKDYVFHKGMGEFEW